MGFSYFANLEKTQSKIITYYYILSSYFFVFCSSVFFISLAPPPFVFLSLGAQLFDTITFRVCTINRGDSLKVLAVVKRCSLSFITHNKIDVYICIYQSTECFSACSARIPIYTRFFLRASRSLFGSVWCVFCRPTLNHRLPFNYNGKRKKTNDNKSLDTCIWIMTHTSSTPPPLKPPKTPSVHKLALFFLSSIPYDNDLNFSVFIFPFFLLRAINSTRSDNWVWASFSNNDQRRE